MGTYWVALKVTIFSLPADRAPYQIGLDCGLNRCAGLLWESPIC